MASSSSLLVLVVLASALCINAIRPIDWPTSDNGKPSARLRLALYGAFPYLSACSLVYGVFLLVEAHDKPFGKFKVVLPRSFLPTAAVIVLVVGSCGTGSAPQTILKRRFWERVYKPALCDNLSGSNI